MQSHTMMPDLSPLQMDDLFAQVALHLARKYEDCETAFLLVTPEPGRMLIIEQRLESDTELLKQATADVNLTEMARVVLDGQGFVTLTVSHRAGPDAPYLRSARIGWVTDDGVDWIQVASLEPVPEAELVR